MMRIAKFCLNGLVCLGLGVHALSAQSDAPETDGQVPTFHAYTNLVQTSVVVLSPDRKPIPLVPEKKFFVSLDGGPRFQVTHARLEGDDPISLAILIDLTQPFPNWMKNIDRAIAALAPLSLTPKDQVSIYALDCQLIGPVSAVPVGSATLRQAVDDALQDWTARGQRRLKSCQTPAHLFDSLMTMTQVLRERAGQRVILVVSDGVDHGSPGFWHSSRLSAQSDGIAIFGVTEINSNSFFNALCDSTGGMVLAAGSKGLADQLRWFTQIVRGRYIVEFPHAVTTTAAYHSMDISIDKADAFVRSSGVLVPVDDPAILKDPMTVPSDPSHAPKLGKH